MNVFYILHSCGPRLHPIHSKHCCLGCWPYLERHWHGCSGSQQIHPEDGCHWCSGEEKAARSTVLKFSVSALPVSHRYKVVLTRNLTEATPDSLVVQMVKIPPAMQDTWVQSLGWGDPLEEGMATLSSILAWRIPIDRGAWWATVHGVAKSQTRLSD